ncbi:N4-gp56 family major capsid protein, partial [Streptomyces sp. P17]|uniref:N4-gp56 family major capsid protein n=1 Tax=Streptomyces sp. P17 TaxID=3074716 RepID=UPI0028F43FE7
DLLAAAGTIIYAGAATADSEISGEETPASGGAPAIPASLVSYKNLMRLDKILNDNRTPRQTKIIAGSRLTDTKVIGSGRVMYIGSDLVSVVRGMTDLFGKPAFISVQHYADAGTLLT